MAFPYGPMAHSYDFKRNPDLQFLELRETDHGDLHVFVKDSREVVVLDGGEHRAVMFD